jgi:hypothetical protein
MKKQKPVMRTWTVTIHHTDMHGMPVETWERVSVRAESDAEAVTVACIRTTLFRAKWCFRISRIDVG